MKPYSKDLRLRILASVDRGMSRKEVARTFGVSEPTIRRYLGLRRQSGGVDPRPPSGPPARKGRALEEALPRQVSRNPDLTLEHGVAVSVSSVSRAFSRLGMPLKKSPSRPPSATRKNGLSGEEGRAG